MNNSATSQLLAKLSTDINTATFIEDTKRSELPPAVNELSQRYIDENIGERDIFIWKWLYNVFDHYQLEIVPDKMSEKARTIKTLFAMFVTIFDDVAEENHDRATYEYIRTIPTPITPMNSLKDVNQPIISILEDIWQRIIDKSIETPRYERFKDLFIYDVHQAINSAYYSMLVNETIDRYDINIATETGLENYDSHNMCFFALLDVDLMIATKLEMSDIALIREIHWDAQQMARIGNWVSTWKREVHERDYTSGVVASALQRDITNIKQIRNDPEAAINSIEASTIERDFIEQWEILHTKIQTTEDTAESVDLHRLADRTEAIMYYHLASEGYK